MYTLARSPYLNTYIFELIFETLDSIVSQVRMARAFPEYINDAIRTWRKYDFTNSIGPNTFMIDCLSDITDYTFFMRRMAPHFKHFKMFEDGYGTFPTLYSYLLHLQSIGLTSLPSVESCTLNGNPDTIVDEDIYDLSLMFPNLKVLRVYMGITGDYIERFEQLQELHLYSEYFVLPLETHIIQSLVLNMETLRVLDIRGPFENDLELADIQLPNLEVLKVNLKTLVGILPQVLALPRLRKLAVLYIISRIHDTPSERTFEHILREKAASITGISINNVSLQLEEHWDADIGQLEFPKLRKLVFENWPHRAPFLSGHSYPKTQLETYGCSLWHCLKAPQLLHLIKEHIKLKELSIAYCYFDKTILKQIEQLLISEAAIYEKKCNTSSEARRAGPRPRLFIWNFCNIMRDLQPGEEKYWRQNKHIEMEMRNYSDFRFQENGYEFDFE